MLLISHQRGAISVRTPPRYSVRSFTIPFAPDIRFYIASSVGVISSSLVITRRLHHVVNMTTIATDVSMARKRRNVLTDLLLGLGIPLLAVALCECPS